jgi:2-methylcitrate dehydratase PrpD
MDAMLKLVLDHDLKPEQVERVRFFAGKNIIEPIRYPIARNHLQAKFSMPALLAMIVLCRRASHHEFEDAFVAGEAMQDLQARTDVINDPEIDARATTSSARASRSRPRTGAPSCNGPTSAIAAAR